VRNGEKVFFKHKYLTQPTVTTEDVLIKAADDLSNAIKGVLPSTKQTQVAINRLMEIFKGSAREHKDSTGAQRECIISQRVLKEAEVQPVSTTTPQENDVVHVEYSPIANSAPQPAMISQQPRRRRARPSSKDKRSKAT